MYISHKIYSRELRNFSYMSGGGGSEGRVRSRLLGKLS